MVVNSKPQEGVLKETPGSSFWRRIRLIFFHTQGRFSDHRRVPTAGSPNITHTTILRFLSAPAERVFDAPFPRVWDGPEVRIRSRLRRLN